MWPRLPSLVGILYPLHRGGRPVHERGERPGLLLRHAGTRTILGEHGAMLLSIRLRPTHRVVLEHGGGSRLPVGLLLAQLGSHLFIFVSEHVIFATHAGEHLLQLRNVFDG